MLDDGLVQSDTDKQEILAELTVILGNIATIDTLATTELTGIKQAIARLGVPIDHKLLNLPRFINNNFLLANSGMITMFLFNNIDKWPGLNLTTPLVNYTTARTAPVPIKLNTMTNRMSQSNDILDLDGASKPGLRSVASVKTLWVNRASNGLTPEDFSFNPTSL